MNRIYYKIPHEIASGPTYSFQKKNGGGIKSKSPKRTLYGPKPGQWWEYLPAVRKTKLSKHEAIERDLKASGIPYTVETTDTHVIVHN